MKTNYLVSSLCLAPLALAAPFSHTVTLVAGKSVFKPSHQIATLFEEVQHVLVSKPSKSHKTIIDESSSPSITLDAERPLTTAELMELSKAAARVPQPMAPHPHPHPKSTSSSHKPKHTKDGATNRKISVGALVVPTPSRVGVMAKIFDPQTSPYLIPGQYVASQRADVLIVGLILACVLIVVAMESWELICNFVSNSSLFRRQGSIRLADDHRVVDLESGESDEEDSEYEEDDCNAPFEGFPKSTRESKSLRLPEKVDEKAVWI